MLENEVFNRPYVRDITKTCECTCSVTCNPDVITNADRIRAMNDDELSKQLVIVIDVDGLQPCRMYLSAPTGKIYLSRSEAIKTTKDWLQQPAEED